MQPSILDTTCGLKFKITTYGIKFKITTYGIRFNITTYGLRFKITTYGLRFKITTYGLRSRSKVQDGILGCICQNSVIHHGFPLKFGGGQVRRFAEDGLCCPVNLPMLSICLCCPVHCRSRNSVKAVAKSSRSLQKLEKRNESSSFYSTRLARFLTLCRERRVQMSI
jgi:hypothetical protein